MNEKELKRALRIRKEIRKEKDYFYIEGNETALHKIEEKLENYECVHDIIREFFTDGFGRICFKVD